MSDFLTLRLALSHIRKNLHTFLPYLMANTLCVLLLYICSSLAANPQLVYNLRGGEWLSTFLILGFGIASLFSLIFLFYTNSFLMKKRKTEFGLYNILGMEKRHVFLIVFFQMMICFSVSMIAGVLLGILAEKASFMILARMLSDAVPFGFHFSWEAVLETLSVMGSIYLLMTVYTFFSINLTKPVSLLNAADTAEKEPKVKWVLSLSGVVFLCAGYWLALSLQDPLSALTFYFLAVALVIAGTYCLFTAGSIAVLKLLQKNRHLYYQTENFINISHMKFRMKQNGVSLANICILSTMVLVAVSTTASLYFGAADSLAIRYPFDVMVSYQTTLGNNFNEEMLTFLEENGFTPKNVSTFTELTSMGMCNGSSVSISEKAIQDNGQWIYVYAITAADYNRCYAQNLHLKEDEVLVSGWNMDTDFSSLDLYGRHFSVQKAETKVNMSPDAMVNVYPALSLIVKNHQVLEEIQAAAHAENKDFDPSFVQKLYFDLPADQSALEADNLLEIWMADHSDQLISSEIPYIQSLKESITADYAGFFFLGILLSILFLAACILIMYYKQISEGMEDRRRFSIMKSVGLSEEQIRKTIRTQVLTVFFLPLAAAMIHVAFNYPIVSRLLRLFAFSNDRCFILVSVVTVLIFSIIYTAVYWMTSRIYYQLSTDPQSS